MANIEKLDRQVKVRWPEFSWLRGEGEDSRCFTMFAPNVSRIGYAEDGRVYSIICPQQGSYSPNFGSLNIEITVTGVRGWMVEDEKNAAADLTVVPKIWFGPGVTTFIPFEIIARIFESRSIAFPLRKSDAIQIKTYHPDEPDNPVLKGFKGVDSRYTPPEFTRHDNAWGVSNLALGVGPHFKTGCKFFDDFADMVMALFNIQSHNLLKPGGTVSWNVYFTPPEPVDHCEWYTHADRWRRSLDSSSNAHRGGSPTRDAQGNVVQPAPDAFQQEMKIILKFLATFLPEIKALGGDAMHKLQDHITSVADTLGMEMKAELGEVMQTASHFEHAVEEDAKKVEHWLTEHFEL